MGVNKIYKKKKVEIKKNPTHYEKDLTEEQQLVHNKSE